MQESSKSINSFATLTRVLVTAGAQGIGYAIAKAFVSEGAKVHICDINPEKLELAQERLGVTGSLVDVSTAVAVERLFEELQTSLGGLSVLINNAGIAGPTALVEDVEPEAWDATMAVNINGMFYCTRHAVPLLKEAQGGSIINISSTAGLFGYPMRSPYAASKWAVIGFTKTLAMELGRFNIRANAICPGSINNERMDTVIEREATARGLSAQEVRVAYEKQVSMQTFIDPEDIANLAVFLASDKGAKVSGQALSVDGHTETMRT